MEDKPNIKDRIVNFFRKCIRIWHVLRKPTREEFITVAKVSAIGIGLIGLIGFVILLLMRFTVLK